MAITEKTEPFKASLGKFAEIARTRGIGQPIQKIAASTSEVSLSTLKKLMNGEHIRQKQFHAAAQAFGLSALDWIELKIRYMEAYLQEYLVKDTENRVQTGFKNRDVEEFFKIRNDPKHQELFPTRQTRFSCFIGIHFKKQGTLPKGVSGAEGGSKKKDMWTVSRQTVNAFRQGEHVRPNKFKLICRNLEIEKSERTIAKILYSEAYLGTFLLGQDASTFQNLNRKHHPRTAALLIYSAKNRDVLP